MKREPIPEIEAAAGNLIVRKERGENIDAAILELEGRVETLGLDSEEAFTVVKAALKRARARHAAAVHGLRTLKVKADALDASVGALIDRIAEFETDAASIADLLEDHMDVSPLRSGEWRNAIGDRLTSRSKGRIASRVPSFEVLRDASSAVSLPNADGARL